jgi:hypothetical protein
MECVCVLITKESTGLCSINVSIACNLTSS